jgi:predicted acyltransferase
VPGEGAIGALLLHDRSRNLSAWFDRLTLDWTRWGLGNHIWSDSITYDPEGLLSTLPAVATAMLGVLAGRWIAARERALVERLTGLFAAGALAIMLGLMWNWSFPINKPIWSSSYVLFTAGVACIALGTVGWLVDVVRLERWARPFLVYGTNAIVAYVGAELLAHILHSSVRWKVGGHWTPTELVVTRGFVALGLAPETASLAWALLYVALWYVILTQLYRRRIFVRI